MSLRGIRPGRLWERSDIYVCNCDEYGGVGCKVKKHVHCPCLTCGNKAVARSVEYRHYQQQQILVASQATVE